jgi:hypothetical protein
LLDSPPSEPIFRQSKGGHRSNRCGQAVEPKAKEGAMNNLKGKRKMRAETLVGRMTRQEALMVIAIHANKPFCSPGEEICAQNIERLVILCQGHPLFEESAEDIRKRINRLVNMEHMHGQMSLLQKAVETLPAELHPTALDWVGKMLEPQSIADSAKKEILKKLAQLLQSKVP